MIHIFKNLFCSRNLLRYLSIFLCCLLLVFGCQLLKPLEAEAVAVVDDAVILIIIAILAAFGINFATAQSANNMATTWHNSMTPDILAPIRDIIDSGKFVLGAAWCLIEFTASEWHKLWTSFCSTFPQYANLGHQTLTLSADVQQQIMSTGLHSYLTSGNVLDLGDLPVGVDVDITFQSSANSIIRYCGKETIDKCYGDIYNYCNWSIPFNNFNYLVSSNLSLDLVSISLFSTMDSYVTYPASNLYYGDVLGNGTSFSFFYDIPSLSSTKNTLSTNLFFKGEKVDFTTNEYGRYVLTTPSYGNLIAYWVSSGAIPQSSPLINCDDWTYKGDIDALLPCKDVSDVGLDFEHAPAIDGYPSQVGDASDVDSYPDTIPLNVPTSITNDTVGDLTADRVRDITISDSNTDTDIPSLEVLPPDDSTIELKDKFVTNLNDGMPFTDSLFDFFRGFEKQAKPLKFDFEFRGKKYSITTDFYTPYRERIRSVLCVFFAVISLLAIWRMWRSLLGQGIGSVSGLNYSGSSSSNSTSIVKKGD